MHIKTGCRNLSSVVLANGAGALMPALFTRKSKVSLSKTSFKVAFKSSAKSCKSAYYAGI